MCESPDAYPIDPAGRDRRDGLQRDPARGLQKRGAARNVAPAHSLAKRIRIEVVQQHDLGAAGEGTVELVEGIDLDFQEARFRRESACGGNGLFDRVGPLPEPGEVVVP